MKFLHTSDWHIGRTFHGHSTTEHLTEVLSAIAHEVAERKIDVVLVAGDVFDSSAPAAAYFTILTNAIKAIRTAGAQVIISSGNHDSATRLGFQSEWAGLGGVHVMTRADQAWAPVVIDGVNFYGVPYLEPFLVKDDYPDEMLTTHEQVLGFVMGRIREDMSKRNGPSVVLSHCFAAGVEPTDVERDVSAGGLGIVSTAVFEGADYVGLGHIHGQAVLATNIRYSGAPLYYSFKEANKKRGGWIVDLDSTGLGDVTWLDLPIPRRVTTITDTIDELLTSSKYAEFEGDWVSAVITDQVRPMDAMSRLHTRFPYCATLDFAPAIVADDAPTTYGARVVGKSDGEVVDGFLEFVRNGQAATEFESKIVHETLTALAAEESAR
jgi:DNA repair protein SbcD/Mre11